MIRLFRISLIALVFLSYQAKAQDSDIFQTTEPISESPYSSGEPQNVRTPTDEDLGTVEDAPQPPPTSPPTSVSPLPVATMRQQPSASGSGPTQEEYDELVDRMDMMEEDIERLLGEQDKLRAENALDRLNWSGSYRLIFNDYYLSDRTIEEIISHVMLVVGPTGAPVMGDNGMPLFEAQTRQLEEDRDEWLSPTWTHRLKLAMSYDLGKNLRFFSQLGVYKYFNETLNTTGMVDHGSNAYPRDNSFRLERVYLDWFISKWFAISVGRIASPDGPPTELKENAERRSGWGVQMVNATIDTVMTTFYLAPKTYLRLFYSPYGVHSPYTMKSEISLMDDQDIKTLHSWGALFEVGIPKSNESVFQLGFLHIPRFTPRTMRIDFPGNVSPMPIAPSKPEGDNLGMYMAANTLLLFKDVFNSGLDLFAAYGMTILKPTESRMVYQVPMELPIHHPRGGDTGEVLGVWAHRLGLASFEEGPGTTNLGHTIFAGFRYTLPTSEQYPTRFGGEFNWGSQYHLAWSHPNEQLLNKMGNKGWAAEGYIIQQLVPEHLFMRVGYLELQKNYSGLFVGPTNKVDQRFRNINLTVNLSW